MDLVIKLDNELRIHVGELVYGNSTLERVSKRPNYVTSVQ